MRLSTYPVVALLLPLIVIAGFIPDIVIVLVIFGIAALHFFAIFRSVGSHQGVRLAGYVATFLYGVGILILIGGVAVGADDYLFRRRGERGVATITAKYIEPAGKRFHVVEYSFLVEGSPYSGSAKPGKSEWLRLETGDPIAILYLRHDPRKNRLDGSSSATFLIALGVLSWVAGGVQRRRFSTLASRGEEAPAKQVSLERLPYLRLPKKREMAAPIFRLTYSFRYLGREYTGSALIPRLLGRDFRFDKLHVLYDPRDLGNSIALWESGFSEWTDNDSSTRKQTITPELPSPE
jgi:hypothetical protein